MKAFIILGLTLFVSPAMANNLHLIDTDPQTGFAIYRTGEPSKKEIKELCKLGITEIAVLSGNAKDVEMKYASACPTLKVVYNVKQDADVPVTEKFLNDFDTWVTESHKAGKKIAFRCSCGCHRTGRLAAYYQMKYQGMTAKQAIDVMNDLGKWMWFHPELKPQVLALNDYIHGKSCSTKQKYCVRK